MNTEEIINSWLIALGIECLLEKDKDKFWRLTQQCVLSDEEALHSKLITNE